MKVNNILALTIILLNISIPVFGQTENIINQSFNQIKAENVVLQNSLKEIEAKLNEIEVYLYRQNAELENIKMECDSLKEYRHTLWEQFSQKDTFEKAIANKKKMLKNNEQHLNSIENILADITLEKCDIESHIKNKGEKYVKLLFNITTKPYSSVTTDEIENVKLALNYFSELECCREYSPKLKNFEEVYNLYHEAKNALCKECNSLEIKNFRDQIINILNAYDLASNKMITKEQYEELDKLDIALSRYSLGGVTELHKIVTDINNDPRIIELRDKGDREECIKLMMLYIEKNDNNKRAFERYFEVVPYFDNLRIKYWEELQANPIDTTSIENEIIKLWKLWN